MRLDCVVLITLVGPIRAVACSVCFVVWGAGWLSFFVCFEFAAVIVVWWIWWFGFVGGLVDCCGFACMCFLVVALG